MRERFDDLGVSPHDLGNLSGVCPVFGLEIVKRSPMSTSRIDASNAVTFGFSICTVTVGYRVSSVVPAASSHVATLANCES
jgi:hypothetical protein